MTLLRNSSSVHCAPLARTQRCARIKGTDSRREFRCRRNPDGCVSIGCIGGKPITSGVIRRFLIDIAEEWLLCSAPLPCLEILLSPYSLPGGNGKCFNITSATSRVWWHTGGQRATEIAWQKTTLLNQATNNSLVIANSKSRRRRRSLLLRVATT